MVNDGSVIAKFRLKDDTAKRPKARFVERTTSPTFVFHDSTLGSNRPQ
jgi:hypothetical protein